MYARFGKQAVVVQKYGGTSVGSVERIASVAERIAKQYRDGYTNLAIVVSAMSGETNRLVDLVKQVNPRANEKFYDLAVAAGEQVSIALLAAALERNGVQARCFLAFQLGIFTDPLHAKARIQSIDTRDIFNCWNVGILPVIAGFQGISEEGELTTLGRGGSDTSAVAIAAALKADFCEINTDVNGVYSADPRLIPDARLIRELDYEVALEMAALGSKVLHSRCVELGAKYKMPIVVRNSFNPNDSERTIIMNSINSTEILEAPLVSGITLDKNIAKLSITRLPKVSGLITEIFGAIAERNINVDIIVHNLLADEDSMRVGFTIAREDLPATEEVLRSLNRKPPFREMSIFAEDGFAKVSAVGVGMKSQSGVAGRIFAALSQKEVDIHMISTSEIKVSCVVRSEDAQRTAESLHQAFFG